MSTETEDSVVLVDRDGIDRHFNLAEIYEQMIAGGFMLYGMTLNTILQMRTEYRIAGGEDPISPEKVTEILRGRHSADLLAATVHSQKVHLNTVCEEIRRAHDALDSAGHPTLRGGSEELGDGICRLAGERDEFKSLIAQVAVEVGVDPTGLVEYHIAVQKVMQLVAAAKLQAQLAAEKQQQLAHMENALAAERMKRLAAESDRSEARLRLERMKALMEETCPL